MAGQTLLHFALPLAVGGALLAIVLVRRKNAMHLEEYQASLSALQAQPPRVGAEQFMRLVEWHMSQARQAQAQAEQLMQQEEPAQEEAPQPADPPDKLEP